MTSVESKMQEKNKSGVKDHTNNTVKEEIETRQPFTDCENEKKSRNMHVINQVVDIPNIQTCQL